MRLDRTGIAIRERSLLDILDMSLRVLAVFAGRLLVCLAIVVAPLMTINGQLIGWLPEAGDVAESYARYLWIMALLVIIQAPLASLCVTPFLGHAMFMEEVRLRDILRTLRHSLVPLVLCQLLLRGIGLSWILAALIPRGSDFSGWEVWLVLLAIYSVLFRAARPFINEIILLERNPLRSKSKQVITVGRRSAALHGPNSGDLISRWMATALIAILLAIAILATLWFLWGMLLFDWNWGPVMLHVCYPLSLWIVAGYFAVVRFLCYLDLRIRREGWEVELVMRAAANQLTGPTA